MLERLWGKVDAYFAGLFLKPDQALAAALEASEKAGLPAISVSPLQGRLLMLLAQIQGARHSREIGSLGGYSTIWLARALPAGGRLITLELDPHHAEVARANIARAGLAHCVELRQGKAIETLSKLAEEGLAPFDLVFIDADKPSTTAYFDWALKLSRRGSVIIVDNVVRDGEVAEAASPDPNVQGIRKFSARVAAEGRVSATAIQTVGSKGYDGFALVRVIDGPSP